MIDLKSKPYLFWKSQLDKIQNILLKNYQMNLYDAQNLRTLAAAILKLSDHYQSTQDKLKITDWSDKKNQMAYLAYFHFLNLQRSRRVFTQADQFNFFQGVELVLDFGSGLGAGSYDWKGEKFFFDWPTAHRLHQQIADDVPSPDHWRSQDLDLSDFLALKQKKSVLGIFSFSLVEMKSWPEWIFNLDKIIFIEPSVQNISRDLMALRQTLIENSFQVVAPCVHQEACPMLTYSKKDWCHDRLDTFQPDWFKALETVLPIKNQTLTLSYLAVQKKMVTQKESQSTGGNARVVSDWLPEKGKSRLMICQNQHRQFLSALKRNSEINIEFKRGQLIQLDDSLDFMKTSAEIRVERTDQVKEIIANNGVSDGN